MTALLAALADRVIADMRTLPAIGDTPQERIASLAQQLRAELLAHPHRVNVVHQQARTASMFQPVNAAIASELARLDCGGAQAALVLRSLQVHVVGSVLLERSIERFGERHDDAAPVDTRVGGLGDEALAAAMARPSDRVELFEYGLQALLATLDRPGGNKVARTPGQTGDHRGTGGAVSDRLEQIEAIKQLKAR